MKAAEFLRQAEHLPLVGLRQLIPTGSALVLAPHPDDESLGCGGLLAMLAADGRPGRVVVMSDGAGSHPRSRTHPGPVLRALRRDEATRATEALSTTAPTFLDWPDGGVPNSGADFERAVASVLTAADGVTTIVATIDLDPHKDHAATWAVAKAAASQGGMSLLGYAIWSWRHVYPAIAPIEDVELSGPPCGMRLDIAAVLPRKRQAVEQHRSQTTRLIADDPEGFLLTPPMLEIMLRPFEVYFTEPRR